MLKEVIKIADKKIGVVTHFYDKISVAVVKLEKGDLKVGDQIKFVDSAGDEFKQKVESMQIEHANIDIAKASDEFGLKVINAVKPKTQVFKVA